VVTIADVEISNRAGIEHFSYRHGLISPLSFLGILDDGGAPIPLPPIQRNFFYLSQSIFSDLLSSGTSIAELGALTQPLFRKPEHAVTYIDYQYTTELIKKNQRLLKMKNEIFAEVDVLTETFLGSRP
jgi:hypothetical protein